MVQRSVSWFSVTRAIAHSLPASSAVKRTAHMYYLWLAQHWEKLLIAALLLVAALAHGINMFNYPTYLGDEGIYMSQAWAVVKEGQLAPYTYDYGHAPVSWLLIAAWTLLTGGFHTFGTTINSGRVLMLITQVGSTFLLYRIARSISNSVVVATIACLLFALSPYGIYIHRFVLLDNIATFWMLLSIMLLVSKRLSLKRVWLSAVALGLSILSKENISFLMPVLVYLVYFLTDKSHRWFAVVGWTAIVCSIVSLYVLVAVLKGELFPSGTLLGGTSPHVSLLYSLLWQAGRQRDGGVLDLSSQFWHTTNMWAQAEPLLVIGGSFLAILSILMINKHRLIGLMGIATLSLYAFLARGGITLGFYLAPSLPLLALNVALMLGLAANYGKTFLKKYKSIGLMAARGLQMIMVGLCLAGIVAGYSSPNLGFKWNPFLLWNASSDVVAQRVALNWITKNISSCSSMIIDPYMWTDLHDVPNSTESYTLAHSYWQVALDPAITDGVFHDDWRNIDYVITTPGLLSDTTSYQLQLVKEALVHSTPIARFDTSGWPIVVRQVNNGKVKRDLGCSNPAMSGQGT